MTDKQIIIDGVDVSGCNRLNIFPMQYGEPHEICLTSLEQWGGQEKYCKDRPNCYYKQLEKLKAENLGFKILHESDKDLLKRKEQECERLRFPMPDTNYAILTKEEFEQLDQLKLENKHLNDLLNQALKELEKTRETLTEIKEIAEKGFESSQLTKLILDLILQKISECEGNDE